MKHSGMLLRMRHGGAQRPPMRGWLASIIAAVLLMLGGMAPGWANPVWEFVDQDGVTHIGNAPAPATARGLIWLSQVPTATAAGAGRGRGGAAVSTMPRGHDEIKQHLEAAAIAQSLDPALVIAVAATESAFNVKAVSRKGALGLMQVMPATAERYGVAGRAADSDVHAAMEPKTNAQIGTRYLADLLRMFDGDKELALAAYNAGEGAVIKYGRRIPPYPETQQYVEKVMRLYRGMTR